MRKWRTGVGELSGQEMVGTIPSCLEHRTVMGGPVPGADRQAEGSEEAGEDCATGGIQRGGFRSKRLPL